MEDYKMFKNKRKLILEVSEELNQSNVIDLYKKLQSLKSYLNRDEFKNLLNFIKEYKNDPENESNKLLISRNEKTIYEFESKLKEYKILLQQYNNLSEKDKNLINDYNQKQKELTAKRKEYEIKRQEEEQEQKNQKDYEFRNSYNPNSNPSEEEMLKKLPENILNSFNNVFYKYSNGYIDKPEFIDEITMLCHDNLEQQKTLYSSSSKQIIITVNNYIMTTFNLFIEEIFPKEKYGLLGSISIFLGDRNKEVLDKNIAKANKTNIVSTFPVYPFSSLSNIESVIKELKSQNFKNRYSEEYPDIINAIANIFEIVNDVIITPERYDIQKLIENLRK